MGLQQKLDDDLKAAMRTRDQERLEAIRQIKSTVTIEELRQSGPLTDGQIQDIVARLVRQHRESIELFTKGNRMELAERETAQLDVLLSYLPNQLSTQDVETLVRQIAEDLDAKGPSDKGKVMGKVMPQVKGKMDGKAVNSIVDQILSNLS